MTNRDNKAAAAEFRELIGIEFDEFTRQAPVKLLLALRKFIEPIDLQCSNLLMSRIRCFSSSARN